MPTLYKTITNLNIQFIILQSLKCHKYFLIQMLSVDVLNFLFKEFKNFR